MKGRFCSQVLTFLVALIFIACPTVGYALPVKLRPIDLPGLGRIILPQNVQAIRVTEKDIPKYNLLVDDGQVLHFSQILAIKPKNFMSQKVQKAFWGESNSKKMLTAIRESLIQKAIRGNSKLINIFSIYTKKIAGQEWWIGAFRISSPAQAPFPIFTQINLLNNPDKQMAVIYTCPDSDNLYWQPVMQEMIASLNSPVIIFAL